MVLAISILASFVAFLDGSVVNVALPAISRDLGGGLVTQQWVVDAYLLTLGALILLAGSLSDLFGRTRIMAAGLIWFGAASLLCALAPDSALLVAARALQGIGGALLVPSSLALIVSTFSGDAQGKAIGRWTAWTGVSYIIGPLLGGFLVDTLSWRFIFVINVAPILLCLWLLTQLRQPHEATHATVDIAGAILCTAGLGATVFALIEQPRFGWDSAGTLGPLATGCALLATFIYYEHRQRTPMLPLSLFRIRNFLNGNIATVGIYSGLSIATFLVVIFLQQVGSYSAFAAGLALLPVTILMFLLSPRFGAMAGRYGPRLFMTAGPLIAGTGFLLMLRVGVPVRYWTELLPGVLLFGLGLSVTVAPLTAAVLGDIDAGRAGIASAVNNAVARVAGLVAIAAIGVIAGPSITLGGFRKGITLTAALIVAGGVVSAIGIRGRQAAKR